MYERYVELRNQKGVSDYRVAKDTGIPKSTFSDWKSGRSKPKIAKLKILAGYFGVAVDELISATDETGSEEGREQMLIGILAALSMIAIAKAIYWKLCFQGVLLYIAECGNPLPNTTLIKKYAERVALKALHIKED